MIKNSIVKRLLISITLGLTLPAVPFLFSPFLDWSTIIEAIGVTLGLGLFGVPAPVFYFGCERWLPKRTILKHVLFIGYWLGWTTLLYYSEDECGMLAEMIKSVSMFSVVSYLTILFTKPSRSF